MLDITSNLHFGFWKAFDSDLFEDFVIMACCRYEVPSAPCWVENTNSSAAKLLEVGAHRSEVEDDDAFDAVVGSGRRDDDDDVMALGLDASELQEFFGDS
jgi:hypothetical protein